MMVRGRKPLSSAQKEASGAFAHNPKRRNKNEPQVKLGWPKMPTQVAKDAIAKECWQDVCSTLEEMNLLTTADKHLLAAYCMDYAQFCWLWEQCKEGNVTIFNDKGNAAVHPAANQIHKYADRLLKRQSELGLTPSSRSRLHAPKQEEDDPFVAWLQEATGSDN
jgi:P27 family predicted phage terminase small subunit